MIEPEKLAPPTRRPPMPGPLVVLTNGMALILQPDGSHAMQRLEAGLTLGWMDTPELGGIILSIRDAHCHAEGLVTTLSRPGLRGLIEDLQDIDAQLGERR
ncbi:hypothetical protein [Sphingomonas hengshuiensis]|uniref:Uncharacterized protein n=1 Tax=Sphingomonas hengshuiensis TaxID=1609977 RepID=A0A7U4J9Z5_9SPHN|nr:hypothetical protein [Sphingomonas hengshuiensis]AJP72953.1 hypothetical protein TS85_15870 [Sphingomonas hengshuiensis]